MSNITSVKYSFYKNRNLTQNLLHQHIVRIMQRIVTCETDLTRSLINRLSSKYLVMEIEYMITIYQVVSELVLILEEWVSYQKLSIWEYIYIYLQS